MNTKLTLALSIIGYILFDFAVLYLANLVNFRRRGRTLEVEPTILFAIFPIVPIFIGLVGFLIPFLYSKFAEKFKYVSPAYLAKQTHIKYEAYKKNKKTFKDSEMKIKNDWNNGTKGVASSSLNRRFD